MSVYCLLCFMYYILSIIYYLLGCCLSPRNLSPRHRPRPFPGGNMCTGAASQKIPLFTEMAPMSNWSISHDIRSCFCGLVCAIGQDPNHVDWRLPGKERIAKIAKLRNIFCDDFDFLGGYMPHDTLQIFLVSVLLSARVKRFSRIWDYWDYWLPNLEETEYILLRHHLPQGRVHLGVGQVTVTCVQYSTVYRHLRQVECTVTCVQYSQV